VDGRQVNAKLLLAALLAAALTGCTSTEAGQPQPAPAPTTAAAPTSTTAVTAEDAFYADVMDTPGLTSTVAKADLIRVGHSACTVIGTAGLTREAAIAELGTSKWGPQVMEVVLDAAQRNLCPEKSWATAAATAAASAPAVAPTPPTITDGTYEVGVDIEPGKYKSSGTTGYGCYYARLKANDGSLGDIIQNNNSQGPSVVTIKESDGYFETTGCAPWVKQ
jgi:hypothetical protein